MHSLFVGYGYRPFLVEGDEPDAMHQQMAATLDQVFDEIRRIQTRARAGCHAGAADLADDHPPHAKGLDRPEGGGRPEDRRVLALAPGAVRRDGEKPAHVRLLEQWMQSYRPAELFDEQGTLRPEIAALAPKGDRRMSANPHANGGLLMRELELPDIADYAVEVGRPGEQRCRGDLGDGRLAARRDARQRRRSATSACSARTRPRRTGCRMSSRSPTARGTRRRCPYDDHLAPDGRVMEILSEHTCQGWFEGYLLTGRHGLFNCYEAFIHIINSMFNQHAKWLKTCNEIPWRRPIPSLNYLLTSHVWRQDHNGFSHQDPGFIDYVCNKKSDIVRVYLPPDANSLLFVTDHCLRSWNRVNVIVAGKQPAPQWLTMDAAVKHCTAGIGIWEWASNDRDSAPDVVMACAGDVPTLETLAAVDVLRRPGP